MMSCLSALSSCVMPTLLERAARKMETIRDGHELCAYMAGTQEDASPRLERPYTTRTKSSRATSAAFLQGTLCTSEFGTGHHLHGLGDLLDAGDGFETNTNCVPGIDTSQG